MFWVDMETLALKWFSPKKSETSTQIFFTDVERVVPGEDADFWRVSESHNRHVYEIK